MNVNVELNVVCTCGEKNWNTRSNAVHASCELSGSTTCSALNGRGLEGKALGRK
jgi:hypothetical protein